MLPESDVLSLIKRSPDIGDGWRQCSEIIWRLLSKMPESEFVELDAGSKRIRITESGEAVCMFLFKKGGGQ
jgi:hypothetical protein